MIDIFADRSIPIRNMERASGFINTEELVVQHDDGQRFADCGTPPMGMDYTANHAGYNVLVRGDSSSATVKVTARFRFVQPGGLFTLECSSFGRWETGFEREVKDRAEGRVSPRAEMVAPNERGSAQPVGECADLNHVERDGDDLRVTVFRSGGFGPCSKRKDCRFREGSLNMSRETAIARCLNEEKKE